MMAAREHFLNPQNVGDVTDPQTWGTAGALTCGAVVKITLAVSSERSISQAKFRAAGCSRLVAACSILTSLVHNKTTAEAAKLARSAAQVLEEELGPPPSGKEHCTALAGQAMLLAITRYSDAVRAEWSGDEALICTCFGVSDRQLEQEIIAGKLQTVEEVTAACNAGAGCRSCYGLIQDVLDEVAQEVRSDHDLPR